MLGINLAVNRRTLPAWATPSLDITLFGAPSLDSRFTFTRASSATYEGPTGPITVTTDAPRLTGQGLLVEVGPSTNVLLNSATLATQNVTVAATAHTLSFYGTGTVTLSGAANIVIDGTGDYPTRTQSTFTPSAGTLTLTVTGDVLWAQLEALSYASSWIPTTGATATRAAENALILDATLFGTASAATVGAEYSIPTVFSTSTVSTNPATLSSNSTTNRLNMNCSPSAGATISRATVSGATTILASHGNISTNQIVRHIIAASAGDYAAALNGTFGTSSTPAGYPTGMNTLYLGKITASGTTAPVYIRRVCFWDRRLSNAEIVAWSA